MGWLAVDGTEVALVRSGRSLPHHHSPRPYLHPITTLGGRVLTQSGPDDHRHHHGLSLAIADVNGTTYWGGPSYVPQQGYQLLTNHGRIVGETPDALPEGVVMQLTWLDCFDEPLATERRTLRADPWRDGWALSWLSEITAGATDLVFGSPATRGRAGAGYGGIFWRLSDEAPTRVAVDEGEGVEVAYGSTSRWLALSQGGAADAPDGGADDACTVVLAQTGEVALPWFVRTEGYVGAGPAVAWSQPRRLAAGERWELGLVAGVLDRTLRADDGEALVRYATAMSAGLPI